MTVYSPHQSFVTKLAFFAISASKRDRQLSNEVSIYSQDNTSSPGLYERMEYFQNDCCHPWTKYFQELIFKASKNR